MIKATTTLFLILLLTGCKDEQAIYRETENEAFTDVWEQVVDSVFIDKSILNPPPYELYVIQTGNEKNIDTTGFGNKIAKWEKEQDSLSKRPTPYTITVKDSLADFDRYTAGKDLGQDSLIIPTGQKMLNPLLAKKISSKKYRFVPLSSYGNINRRNDHQEAFQKTDGGMLFSHIVFNSDYTKGVLETAFFISPEYGRVFKVVLKRENEKWVVTEIKEIGVF